MFGYQRNVFHIFFPICIILNHMSASVCILNICRTYQSWIKYNIVVLPYCIEFIHTSTEYFWFVWYGLFLLFDWFKILQKLLQRLTHFSMLPFIFTPEICYIVTGRQKLNFHIRILLSFAKLKKPRFTHIKKSLQKF